MSPEFSDDEISLAWAIGGPLKPVHVPVERASEHPLLRHAVIDENGYPQWPGFSERQVQVARDAARLITHQGQRVYSLPPRVNADWFLPSNPTEVNLRLRYGSHDDLQRWYLVIDPVADPCEVRLFTAFTVDGLRTFAVRAQRAGWAPIPAGHFVGLLDNPELVVVPTDQIASNTWEYIWRLRTGG